MGKFFKMLLRVLIIIIVCVVLVCAVAFGYFYYTRWSKANGELITYSGDKMIIKSTKDQLEPTITGLCLGVNDGLTDFIMLCKYDPNTRQVFLLSIPRDTKFDDTDRKINSVYAWYGGKAEKTVEAVEKLTGVDIEYYVVFKTKLLREVVDEIDGVTIDVPINMNYDDPYQNLHIHLKKGIQKLDGSKAEQFVRFRKNNDGTGYVKGDEDRIKAQQSFIKAMVSRCLEPQNILKASKLMKIVFDNVKTNVTQEIASEYVDDAVAFEADRVRMEVLPGAGGYASNGVSYFFMDDEKAEELINEMFFGESTIQDVEEIKKELEEAKKTLREIQSGDTIRIEVLNNGTKYSTFDKVVNKLNEEGYNVVRVGNLNSEDTLSRVITYVSSESGYEYLDKIGQLVGIKKYEVAKEPDVEVDFTVVLGPKYTF